MDDVSTAAIWLKLESQYMSKSLSNKLNLKRKLYELKMAEGADLAQHVHTFNKIISDLLQINIKFDDENKAMILLSSLPASYEHLVTTLLWGKETLEFEEISGALLDHYQRKQNSGESFGEGFVRESKETRDDDKCRMGRTRYEGGQYNLTMSSRRAYT